MSYSDELPTPPAGIGEGSIRYREWDDHWQETKEFSNIQRYPDSFKQLMNAYNFVGNEEALAKLWVKQQVMHPNATNPEELVNVIRQRLERLAVNSGTEPTTVETPETKVTTSSDRTPRSSDRWIDSSTDNSPPAWFRDRLAKRGADADEIAGTWQGITDQIGSTNTQDVYNELERRHSAPHTDSPVDNVDNSKALTPPGYYSFDPTMFQTSDTPIIYSTASHHQMHGLQQSAPPELGGDDGTDGKKTEQSSAPIPRLRLVRVLS